MATRSLLAITRRCGAMGCRHRTGTNRPGVGPCSPALRGRLVWVFVTFAKLSRWIHPEWKRSLLDPHIMLVAKLKVNDVVGGARNGND